ncbi:hypothetical protein EDM59_23050 [Brevibacillus nitrificans]|uniref:BIG2 domain-containing protein n=2 Tax=Brevibacillus nitrificans TaxID=651560 RepID=A0A3M8D0X4_9BACL|nr:hypothetical protein EDM59_23050 [Brevibacillus nitrificans]
MGVCKSLNRHGSFQKLIPSKEKEGSYLMCSRFTRVFVVMMAFLLAFTAFPQQSFLGLEEANAAEAPSNQLSTLATSIPDIVFDPDVEIYSADVPVEVSTITIKAKTVDPAATMRIVEWHMDLPQETEKLLALEKGQNSISIQVTATDNSQKTYVLNVKRAAAPISSEKLSGLTSSVGSLDPVFSPDTTNYTLAVGNQVGEITLIPSLADSSSTLQVNGSTHASGAGYVKSLNLGDNSIEFKVTASDGTTTKTYTVNVKREIFVNNTLTDLEFEGGTLSPGFSSNTLNYTVNVDTNVTSIKMKPVTFQSTAKVEVNGSTLAAGSWYTSPALAVGEKTFAIKVTPSGIVGSQSPMTYTIKVNRAAPSADNNLAGITLSSGSLSPVFSPSTTSYVVSLEYDVANIQITPHLSDNTARITVDGTAHTNNTPYTFPASYLTGGGLEKYIPIIVTAQNGDAKKYWIRISRLSPAFDNNYLSNLSLSNGFVMPTFNSLIDSYSRNVGNEVDSITVTPVALSSIATIKVNSEPVVSGRDSQPIALQVGENTIRIEVQANNGPVRTYTLTVTRAKSSDNTLSALGVSKGTLSPVFDPSTYQYSVTIPYKEMSLTITPTGKHEKATIKVEGIPVTSGQGYAVNNLGVGEKQIKIEVTAENSSVQEYFLDITREAASTDADLDELELSSGTLSPAFSADETNYTTSVPNSVSKLTITPTASDSNASVNINGVLVVNGTTSAPIALKVGSNPITVLVTAEDDETTKTYTIDVKRGSAPTPSTPSNPEVPVTGVSLSENQLILQAGAEATALTATVMPASATNKALNWTSSDPKVAKVDSKGKVTPLAPGNATITVTTVDGNKTASVEVTVGEEEGTLRLEASSTSFHLEPKNSVRFKVYAVMGKEKTEITKRKDIEYSSDSKLVSVKPGEITAGAKNGNAVITVRYQGLELKLRVSVKENAGILDAAESIYWVKPKRSIGLKVYSISDGKRKDITRSENTSYTVDNDLITVKRGQIVAGNEQGEAVITVHYLGEELRIPVNVSNATLQSLTLTAKQGVLKRKEEQQLKLTVTLSNKKSKDVTDEAKWSTNNSDVAEITEDGLIIAKKPGIAKITARYAGKMITGKWLVVTERKPNVIRVSQASVSLKVDQEANSLVTAYYDQGFKEALKGTDVEWTSIDPKIVTVKDGVITAVGEGRTSITASFAGKKATIRVTVRK